MKNIFSIVAIILCTSYLSKAQDQAYLELPQVWSMFGYASTEDEEFIGVPSSLTAGVVLVRSF